MKKVENKTTIHVPNAQGVIFGDIRIVKEKQRGVIIECSYFGEFTKPNDCKHMFRNKEYTRQLSNYLGYTIDKTDYTEMDKSNLERLIDINNFEEEEKEQVLSILETYYVSRKIGYAYLKFFEIIQRKNLIKNIKEELLNDNNFVKEVLKNELEKELKNKQENIYQKKLNKV